MRSNLQSAPSQENNKAMPSFAPAAGAYTAPQGHTSGVVPNPALRGNLGKAAPGQEEHTQQYRVPAEVMERYLATRENRDSFVQREEDLRTPINLCQEGPPSPEPLPRFSSPRVPTDLTPISPVADHELVDELTTLALTPSDMAPASAPEPSHLVFAPNPRKVERDSEWDRQTTALLKHAALASQLPRSAAVREAGPREITSITSPRRSSLSTRRKNPTQLLLVGSLLVCLGTALGWLLGHL
jgi:hypothetical protein